MNDKSYVATYGPTALVTGASSGIGQAFAEVLASKGFNLVLVARRKARLETLAEQLSTEHSIEVQNCETDLSKTSAISEITDACKGLDIGLVVSNAGFSVRGLHADQDPQALTDMLMVNCNAAMQLAQHFIPSLVSRGNGGLIFTGSVEGLLGRPYSAAYSASKAFIKNLGEALWAELTPQGIDVLTVCPGPTDTEALANSGADVSQMTNVQSPQDVVNIALENH